MFDAGKLRREGFRVYKASDKTHATDYVPPSIIEGYEIMTYKLR